MIFEMVFSFPKSRYMVILKALCQRKQDTEIVLMSGFVVVASIQKEKTKTNNEFHETCDSIKFYLKKNIFSDISRKYNLRNTVRAAPP